ncbi:hypothetical protein BU26DRAFT_407990, partial [Trematosphaeria pertusa]
DQSERFRIWAGNLGAFQRLPSEASLDYRLRYSRKIAAQIEELLTDLLNTLDHTSPRDRFAQSLASNHAPFDPAFDIHHVRHKFPLLDGEDQAWLAERLVKAITQRRQYLQYARDHRNKLSKEPSDLWQPQDVSHEEHAFPASGQLKQLRTGKTKANRPESTLSATVASTLRLTDITMSQQDFQEDLSQTSYAQSIVEGGTESRLELPRLSDVSKGAETFECPFCFTIQSIQKEGSWRKHAFSDLRPYVCTFAECELKLFPSLRDWSEHEQRHRVQWYCHFCNTGNFETLEKFQRHLRLLHILDLTDDQLDALAEAGRRTVDQISALECPFCHDWEHKLREANPDIIPEGSVVVTPPQFMQHVGAHMRQLALFAVPR